ncbi:MAG: hypothetical protein GKR90_06295 [Pseudomonadales bacterium]|nr:hypothetical protein [Pseudomonadales bacterium]
MNIANLRAHLGEDSATTITRACHDPESIDERDVTILQMNAQTFLRVAVLQYQVLRNSGLVSEGEAAAQTKYAVQVVMDTKYGRFWYQGVRELLLPEIRDIGDEIVQTGQFFPCSAYEEYKDYLSEQRPAST